MRTKNVLSTISMKNIEIESTIAAHTKFDINICGSPSDFDFLIKNNHDLFQNLDKIFKGNFLIFPTKEAKPDCTCGGVIENDITLNGINIKKGKNILCNAQSKNYNELLTFPHFKEAIESLHPYKFFTGFIHLQTNFLNWWLTNPTIFDNYIRIIVGFHGFHQDVIDIVKAHNQRHPTQPIMLVETSEDLIGSNLSNNENMTAIEEHKKKKKENARG